MAKGEESSEHNTEVESFAIANHEDSDNNDSDSGSGSGQRRQDKRRDVSGVHDEPNAYVVERHRKIKKNTHVLHELGVVSLPVQIKGVELKVVQTKQQRSGPSKCVYGPLCLPP